MWSRGTGNHMSATRAEAAGHAPLAAAIEAPLPPPLLATGDRLLIPNVSASSSSSHLFDTSLSPLARALYRSRAVAVFGRVCEAGGSAGRGGRTRANGVIRTPDLIFPRGHCALSASVGELSW